MSLDDLLAGDALFVDANIFTYHFQPHPRRKTRTHPGTGFDHHQAMCDFTHKERAISGRSHRGIACDPRHAVKVGVLTGERRQSLILHYGNDESIIHQ